jgi:octaprenyl-diphosphate synthase
VTEVIGKNVGDDFRERKLSLPLIKAVAAADAAERSFWERTIARGDQREGDLAEAIAILARRHALEATRAEALAWAARAREALDDLPGGELRDALADLAEFVVERVA